MFSQPGMGYDKVSTMFSPEGRLFQVEYAIEAVRKGSLIIGAVSKKENAVVLAAEKRLLPLQEDKQSGSEKLWVIDNHAMAGISGLTADARVLIDQARVKAQTNRLSYDSAIGIKELAREIGDQCQYYTQSAGVRPYGVSLLIAGIDPKNGPKLYNTDPSGSYWGYFACAIGNLQNAARQILEKEYKQDMSLDELQDLCIKVLKGVLETELTSKNFDLSFLKGDKPEFTLLSEDEKQALIDKQ